MADNRRVFLLAFVGMVQHQETGRTRPIHGLSRSLVYQAVVD